MFAQLALHGGPEVRLKPPLAALGRGPDPHCSGVQPQLPREPRTFPQALQGKHRANAGQNSASKQNHPVDAKIPRIPIHEKGSKVYPFKKKTGF